MANENRRFTKCGTRSQAICERDQSGPRSWQETMARRADRIERLSAGHSPMLSQPGALADIVEKVAAL